MLSDMFASPLKYINTQVVLQIDVLFGALTSSNEAMLQSTLLYIHSTPISILVVFQKGIVKTQFNVYKTSLSSIMGFAQ